MMPGRTVIVPLIVNVPEHWMICPDGTVRLPVIVRLPNIGLGSRVLNQFADAIVVVEFDAFP